MVGCRSSPNEDDDREERDHCRLLARFTTDNDLNMEIADAASIYVVVTQDDLSASCYDDVAVWMDSH